MAWDQGPDLGRGSAPSSRRIASAARVGRSRRSRETRHRPDPLEETHVRIKNWIKSVPTLVTIGTVLFLVLSVGSGLLFWGSTFARGMVHDQLAQQKIQFPAKGP